VAAYLIVSETISNPSRFSQYVKTVDPVIIRGWAAGGVWPTGRDNNVIELHQRG
jgi:uncharacterized protein (DUF1330 family)